MKELDPDLFESRWKSYVKDLERLRLSASGDEFDRIGEIQKELDEIVESITEQQKSE